MAHGAELGHHLKPLLVDAAIETDHPGVGHEDVAEPLVRIGHHHHPAVELLGHVEVVLVLAEDQIAVAARSLAPGGEAAAPPRGLGRSRARGRFALLATVAAAIVIVAVATPVVRMAVDAP
ncbi:MAG TPA: hypothetical protein PLY09_02510, partial [Methanothrix sp.]|nr:hypothetical protein [Methanothrix sp.]